MIVFALLALVATHFCHTVQIEVRLVYESADKSITYEGDSRKKISLAEDCTIKDLKDTIAKNENAPPEDIDRLLYRGRTLLSGNLKRANIVLCDIVNQKQNSNIPKLINDFPNLPLIFTSDDRCNLIRGTNLNRPVTAVIKSKDGSIKPAKR